MRAKPIPPEEQYRLIMECRASGLTDYQWCMGHGIKPGTFYNWVKRLRQNGASLPTKRANGTPARQEVVKIDIPGPQSLATALRPEVLSTVGDYPSAASEEYPTVELYLADAFLRLPQHTDPVFLESLVRVLRGGAC